MEYMTAKEAAEKWGISVRQVQSGCESGRIEGAIRKGYMWLINKDAEKPVDGRTKAAKKQKEGKGQLRKAGDSTMDNTYELKLYEQTLLTFELYIGELGGYEARIIGNSESKELLPLDLELTSEGMMKRSQPSNNHCVKEFMPCDPCHYVVKYTHCLHTHSLGATR